MMRRLLLALMLWAVAGIPAFAKVTPDEAARLGKDLTPIGAENGASADGTVPVWKGKSYFNQRQITITRNELEKMRTSDPNAIEQLFHGTEEEEKILFTITKDNLAQYEDKLTEGHKAMFKLYPDYKMNVYQTGRIAFFPDEVYAATKENATRAELVNTDSVKGAVLGYPFPIPGSGAEVMWNHKLKYRGSAVRLFVDSAIVAQDGSYKQSKFTADVLFVYGNLKKRAKAGNYLSLYFLATALEPPRIKGQVTLVHESADATKASRAAWIYDPGLGRVRRAPDVGFDNPTLGTDGEQFNDQIDGFNGALERYDWKLIGKKPVYIAYNSRKIQLPTLKFKDIIKKGHVNQDYQRYELHRVWVVEATLHSGQRHQFKKRRFYFDEDSWAIAAVDCYDNRDQLWKFQEEDLATYPFIPTVSPNPEIVYDVLSGRYYVTGLVNENPYSDWNVDFDEKHFQAQGLSRAAQE